MYLFIEITLTLKKIANCRVGCAHQKALNLKVEGGHSPPYNKNAGINQR
ncbi:hypothetical protein D1AOALGA4SA_1520 [Olavius algarvensis Delta 1 endosymbiont]|nr:hypothetical protein D1AOALGA4SA_1520 [Olavius algarvensis Delta 1 endosymbiont]